MKERFLRRVHTFFLVIFGVTVVVSIAALRTINQQAAGTDWVNHTHDLIGELEAMMANLRNGEGMIRTFVFTEDPRDFADSRAAFGDLMENLAIARALARSEPATGEVFDRLEQIAQRRQAFADSLWRAREQGSNETVRALLRADTGAAAPGDFRREVERLRERQLELLGERDRDLFRQTQETRWIVGAGIAVNFVLFLGVAWLVRDDWENRRRMTAALEEANASLERRVQERTAQLTEANRALAAENLERKWTVLSQEHQLRYNQLIVNSVSDLVFVLTKAMNVTRINPAVAQFTGLTEEQVLGRALGDFVKLPAAPGGASLESLARALKDGRETPPCSATLLNEQGRPVDVTVRLFPLRDNDQVVGAVSIIQLAASARPHTS